MPHYPHTPTHVHGLRNAVRRLQDMATRRHIRISTSDALEMVAAIHGYRTSNALSAAAKAGHHAYPEIVPHAIYIPNNILGLSLCLYAAPDGMIITAPVSDRPQMITITEGAIVIAMPPMHGIPIECPQYTTNTVQAPHRADPPHITDIVHAVTACRHADHFAVHTRTIHGWENIWHDDGTPVTYTSAQDANADLSAFLQDVDVSIMRGDLSPGYTWADYAIVAIDAAGAHTIITPFS